MNILNSRSILEFWIAKCNNCTLEKQAIINILQSNPIITQEKIAKKINKSLRIVKTYMAEMQEKGLIERKNGKREWRMDCIIR